MVRFSLITFLALVSATVGLADPLDSQAILQSEDGVHTMDKWEWSNCGLETDLVQIESIDVNPDPPQPGKDLTVTVKGTAKQVIGNGAYADVVVKIGLVKLLHKQFDICEEARKANASIQCPIEPGKYVVNQTVSLPKEIPRAKFRVEVRAYSDMDEDMVCLNLLADFMKSPFLRFFGS